MEQIHRKKPEEAIVKMLQTGQRQGKALYELINQLLELTKLEEKKLKLHLSEVDIPAYLRERVTSIQALAKQKPIQLSFHSKEVEQKGWIDQQQLERIVFNLLSNAVKFTPKLGKVDFKVLSLSQQELVFEVRDTGIGIPNTQLVKIFDRFYQVEREDYDYQGTGIGLALTKELVELHGGSIRVISEPMKGTSFIVRLTIDKELLPNHEIRDLTMHTNSEVVTQLEESITEDVQATAIDEALPLVLIVEDNQDLNKLLASSLTDAYNVIQTYDGEQGLEAALEQIPDLIISDVMMPKIDGFELVKRLKSNPATSHIPLVLLTARATQEDKITGLELGADDYLPKPFDTQELLIRVKNLIDLRELLKKHFSSQSDHVLQKPEIFKGSPVEQVFMRKLHKILEANYKDESFSATEISEKINMPRRTLDRKLKSLIDLPANKLLQDFRLNKAKQLLIETNLTAGEIAFQIGFSSRAYFNKCFKDKFGMSPLELKKQGFRQ